MGLRVCAKSVENDGAEFGEDFGVADEGVKGPAEEASGGVAAGEEDVEELGAEFGWVAGLGDEGLEKDVFVTFGGAGSILGFEGGKVGG